MSEQNERDDDTDENELDEECSYVFEHLGVTITTEPGWWELEIEAYANREDAPLLLERDDAVGVVQFSIQPEDHKSRISAGALRNWMWEMSTKGKLGRGFDLVELKTKTALILSCSFRPDGLFQRLWYWTDRKRLVLVSYSSEGDPDPDELRECAAMVGHLRVERDNA